MQIVDYPFERIRLRCDRCGREGLYSRDRLASLVHPLTTLPDARNEIARLGGCDRVGNLGMQQCAIYYPDLLAALQAVRPPAG